jgi:hypothetical protein
MSGNLAARLEIAETMFVGFAVSAANAACPDGHPFDCA